jgi:hypothetical protein
MRRPSATKALKLLSLLQAGYPQDRPRIVAKQLLGLCVAQYRRAFVLLLLRAHPRQRRQRQRGRDRDGGQPGGSLAEGYSEQHKRVVFSDWRPAG